jgi:Tfp pilus assembly protein FimV
MNKRAQGARRPLQGAIALVLALGSNAAMALGLGDIRVLSQPGQPLLAEIPVVSADPGELEAAKVALASPATFARVGLERPSGLISALQFDFAQDAQGRAVIRVRSATPVDVPVVSFLIEVDWGRGRLVREYSALVDRPHTAAAIQARRSRRRAWRLPTPSCANPGRLLLLPLRRCHLRPRRLLRRHPQWPPRRARRRSPHRPCRPAG